MRALSVLHVIHTLRPYGAERSTFLLAREQAKRHRVGILAFEGGELEEEIRRAGVYCKVMFPRRTPPLAWQIVRVCREVRAFGAEIVHVVLMGRAVQAVVGAWLAGAKIVGHFRTTPSRKGDTPVTLNKLRLAKLFCRRRNLIVLTESLRCIYEGYGLKCFVVPNALDLYEFDAQMASLPQALKGPEFKILCAARLVPVKNHTALFYAVRMLRSLKADNFKLYLAGDGPLKEQLEALAGDLKIADCVEFLGFRKDIPALMRDCDVLVLSSLYEGFGRVLIEAGAAGKPCVAADIPGPRDVIVDGVTGFLVPPSNPDALAEKLLLLMRDADLRRRMGEAARKRVEQHYTIQRQAELVDAVYAHVLGIARNYGCEEQRRPNDTGRRAEWPAE